MHIQKIISPRPHQLRGMGNLLSGSESVAPVNSIVVHIPPAKTFQEQNTQPDESARLGAEIDILIQHIRSRGQDVNIVFTGPICIGGGQFCDHFAGALTKRAFRFVDGNLMLTTSEFANTPQVARWAECFRRMEEKRQRALEQFVAAERTQQKRTLVLHTTDLARDSYVYRILAEVEFEELKHSLRPPTPSHPVPTARVNLGPRLRVFYQNPSDHAIAMARASKQLGYIDQQELEALEIQGEIAWAEAAKIRSPANTLYVYLQYDDMLYAESYAACLEEARKRKDNSARALEQLERHAKASKTCMDEMYSSERNDIVSKYFSVVIRFDSRQLLSPLHELVVCREVLSYVHSLQAGRLWGAPDLHRLRYLSSADWIPMRVRTIPTNVAGTRQVTREETDREFQKGTPPLPRANQCANDTTPQPPTTSLPVPVPKRVQEVRQAAGVAASPAPSLSASSSSIATAHPQPVYGAGTLPRGARDVKPVHIRLDGDERERK